MNNFTMRLATQICGLPTMRVFDQISDNGAISGGGDMLAGIESMKVEIKQHNTPSNKSKEAEPQPKKDKPIQTDADTLEKLKSARLDMSAEMTAPDFRFKIGGVEMCPSGGITAISGHAKQGKSQYLIILAAAAMSGRPFGNLQRVTASQKILWIDTEQSPFDVYTNMSRLYHLAGIADKTDTEKVGLSVYMLRPFSPADRRLLITAAIEQHNPDIVIIDGVRDLLNNFNDEVESNDVITWLLQTSNQLPHANIFCVLHTNDGSDKMRGHLGTELFNKCADRFDVSKNNGYFSAAHFSRHAEAMDKLNFYIDNEGNLAPYIAERGADMTADLVEAPADILKRLFANGRPQSFKLIVKYFAREAAISQVKARPILKAMITDGVLVKIDDKFKLK